MRRFARGRDEVNLVSTKFASTPGDPSNLLEYLLRTEN